MDDDKGIVYCNRVLQGNWYEASKLEEYKLSKFLDQMKSGDLLLARYRKMCDNLNKPTTLTQTATSINFGNKIALLAPHAPWRLRSGMASSYRVMISYHIPQEIATDPPEDDKKGLLLGGRINANNIMYSQELVDGCQLVGLKKLEPLERSTFIITSADYCNRNEEPLKYSQEFLLMLNSSAKTKPLYVRFDRDPIPGLSGTLPLYLSEHPVSNTRWRVLPVRTPDITRFELEGTNVPVNKDVVINHCSTNLNLGIKVGCWSMGFHGKICAPLMKTCLDVYGREQPNNIWQLYTPIAT